MKIFTRFVCRFETFCLLVILATIGCRSKQAEQAAEFEPNLVHTVKYEIQKDFSMDQASQDATWVVTNLFGTPDEPTLPAVVAEDPDLAAVVRNEALDCAHRGPRARRDVDCFASTALFATA